jgi:drug/metabolite transporter (DMT)-like permease
VYGLISAFGWGAADFTGGLASKQSSASQVLCLAQFSGLIPVLALALLVGEPAPAWPAWLWAAASSACGTTGLLLLYRALAAGQMTLTAPVSALLAAAVPVLVGSVTLGLPDLLTFAGFALALAAIWTISQSPNGSGVGAPADGLQLLGQLGLPLIAGVFFGLYFVLIHQATREAFYWPLAASRSTGTLIMLIFASVVSGSALPKRETWPIVMLGGVLDVAGSAFYVLAAQAGRLDVAAVLGALYPASTVLLARVFLKEKISRLQSFGILLAFGAIILLTV